MADHAHLAMNMFAKVITAFDRAGVWVDGKYETGTDGADYTFSGVIQPTSAKVLLALPEEQRSQAQFTIHTKTELKINDVNGSNVQTFIRYRDGTLLKVSGVGDWSQWSFRRYFATLEEDGRK